MSPNEIDQSQTSFQNAIDYIKSSDFYSYPKYSWIKPLIDKVLADELFDADIVALVDKGENPESTVQTVTQVASKLMTHVVEPRDILAINEITTVSNVGLVNVTEPLKLQTGLNIFYGKNGAGKSSIYNALCSIFGKDKKVNPNLEGQKDDTFCVVKYTDQAGIEKDLRWTMGSKNPHSPTMIFDGQIAQKLVDHDQNNNFKIAHLKQEYFSRLHDLYDKVDGAIKTKSDILQAHIKNIEELNKETLGFLFNLQPEELINVSKESLSKKEQARLKEIEVTLQTLSKGNPEAVVRNLSTDKEKIVDTLTTFGDKGLEGGEWQIRHTKEVLDNLNKRIQIFNETKAALEAGGVTKLAKIVPSDWVQRPLWSAFIAKSIEFTESLDESLRHKYENDICVYCQQKLTTPELKQLVEAYREITAEHKSKLEEEKTSFQEIANKIESVYLTKLTSITDIKEQITGLDSIQSARLGAIDTTTLTAIYAGIKDSLLNVKAITVSDKDLVTLNSFYDTYVALEKVLSAKIDKLNNGITSRESTIKSLDDEASPFRRKNIIQQNLSTIEKYLDIKTKLKDLEEKKAHITSLRKATSTQETTFSDIAGFKEFESCLKNEYDFFNFTPPPFWGLKSITSGGVNKRSYSLGARRLADIFSEGERKLHALADFFAQCEVNKYKGVYIFDDPVNSLDEDNIVKVAKRIIKLVDDGNQVIVFTHNLYFLNALDKKAKKKAFNVVKNRSSNKSKVELTILAEPTNHLKVKLDVIENEIKVLESNPDPTGIQIGVVYDIMSGYIEEYVEKILLGNVVSRYRANIQMGNILEINLNPADILHLIDELYEKTSRYGNRHAKPDNTPEPTFDELKQDFAKLNQKLHY